MVHENIGKTTSGAALFVLWKPCPATQTSWGHLSSVRARGIQAMGMEREANLSEFKSYELLWINLSSGKTEFGHFWPRCLYSSDCRHWHLTESGLELQLSSGSDSLGVCGIQHRKIPNGCKAVFSEKWDFTISGSDWLIHPQISIILLWSVSKFALFFHHSSFKYAWVVRPAGYSSAEIFLGEERQGEKMWNTSPKIPRESTNSLHFCQIAHAEKNNDWEMSVFGLWELKGGFQISVWNYWSFFSFWFVFPRPSDGTVIKISLFTPNDL